MSERLLPYEVLKLVTQMSHELETIFLYDDKTFYTVLKLFTQISHE